MSRKDKEQSKDTNKRYYRDLDRKTKYHNREIKGLNKRKSRILEKEGYKEKSHGWIWLLVIIAILVAVAWYFLGR